MPGEGDYATPWIINFYSCGYKPKVVYSLAGVIVL